MNATALTLVGWDSILCRPIYRHYAASVKPSAKRAKKKATIQLNRSSGPSSVLLNERGGSMDKGDDNIYRESNIVRHGEISVKVSKRRRKKESFVTKEMTQSPTFYQRTHQPNDIHTPTLSINGDEVVNSGDGDNNVIKLSTTIEANVVESLTVVNKTGTKSPSIDNQSGNDHTSQSSGANIKTVDICTPLETTKKRKSIHVSAQHQSNSCIDLRTHSFDSVDIESQNQRSTIIFTSPPKEQQKSPSDAKHATSVVSYIDRSNVNSLHCEMRDSTMAQYVSSPVLDTSLFDNLNPEEKSSNVNRRSYGNGNKPNWGTKVVTDHKFNDTKSGEKQLVGWDDIKCRPIYYIPTRPGRIQQESESNSEVNNLSAIGDENIRVQFKSQKRRVYSSAFRKPCIFKAACHNMDLDSPCTRHVPLDNDVHDDIVERSSHEKVVDSNSDILFDLESTKSTKQSFDKILPCNDEVENHVQPNSKSSLGSARAFFRYLDANHILSIANNYQIYSEDNTKRAVIRTTRRMRYCDQLKDEYHNYCKIVNASEIEPIPIDEFARHWSLYFTKKGIIRDSLLDEG